MKTLQLGLTWFPEQAGGGLQRYYSDLVRTAPPHFDVSGLLLGSDTVARDTAGQLRAFAPADAGLPHKLFYARKAIRHELQHGAIDLVASHFALFALPALDRIDRPHLVHFHGPWAAESQPGPRRHIKHAVETAVYRRVDALIVLSQAFGKILHADYGVPENRIHVIPGGVDFARFDIAPTRTDARHHLAWPTDRPILLAVRRLVRRMGLETLIEAMSLLTSRHPDILLLIAGTGPLAAVLQSQIDAAGLTHNVRLLGFLPDDRLPLAYRAADFSIVPSQELEGFGLVALESLAAGTPAIVTPIGGLPELVAPLAPALVFAAPDATAMADRLNQLLSAPLAPDAEACRSYAVQFDWPRITQRIAACYRQVL